MAMLRLEEVAKRLGISYPAVRMLVLYEEAIPHISIGARGIRVREADLDSYIKSQEEKEGKTSGNQSDREHPDIREPYGGRQLLQGDKQRDKPPGTVKEDS